MKRIACLIIVLLSLSLSLPIVAQHRIGVVGGLNFADFEISGTDESNERDVSSINVFGIGGVIELSLRKYLSLYLTPMYLQKGGKLEAHQNDPAFELNASYVEVPIFLKLTFGNTIKPYIMGGFTIGYLLSSEIEGNLSGITLKGDFKKVTETMDHGIGFGAGISFPVGICSIFLESRYTFGMSDVLTGGDFVASAGTMKLQGHVEPENEVKTKGLQFMTGITFPIGR